MSSENSVEHKYDAIPLDDRVLPEDLERLRLATLRAKLASYGVYAECNADEDLLCRLVRIAEQRAERRLAQEKKRVQHVRGYADE